MTLTSTQLSSALSNSPGFTDGFDLGFVLPAGLTTAQLIADLTVKYQIFNNGTLKNADVVLAVPEPTGLALLGLGAAGLMARRRRGTSQRKAQL